MFGEEVVAPMYPSRYVIVTQRSALYTVQSVIGRDVMSIHQ